jgi:predicted kinase
MIRPIRARTQSGGMLQWPKGGLILVSGPPFQGKSLLATRLVENLPNTFKLEAQDNLATTAECWFPEGPSGVRVEKPTAQLLAAARGIWNRREAPHLPVIVVTARFETKASRRRAAAMARSCGMPFLLVEARSRNIPTMRRIPTLTLPAAEVLARYQRLERALERYEPIDKTEAAALKCLCLKRVLSDLEAAVARVLLRWQQ